MDTNFTFIFQLVNTALLLFLVIGVPYFVIRLIFKTKKLEQRVSALEAQMKRSEQNESI
ncbi:MAG: hypothetical protein LCH34_14555 [Firmicutes bacterium]|nr:hypothetical protein [Bacillota bacterium]